MSLWIVIGVLVLILLFVAGSYNSLIKLKVLCQNAWSDIEVYLKKRHDLIPNIVNVVKGYAKHESETLEKIISARNQAVGAKSVEEQIESESMISGMIPKIFALAEQYPDLKANSNFQDLSNNLAQIEGELSSARRYYNAVVRDFNTKQQLFPSNIIAGLFNFKERAFFEVEEEAKAVPKVEF